MEIRGENHTALCRDGQAGGRTCRRQGRGASPRYRSCLPRYWSDGSGIWRFSVEDPHTGARREVTEMAALVAFLDATLCAEGNGERAASDAPTDAARP
jgi:hypothetical protein